MSRAFPTADRHRGSLGLWPLALALAAASIALAVAGEPATAVLRYERAAVGAGQAWRVLTGNLVHLGPAHLAMNLAALALVTLGVGRMATTPEWAVVALACALGVGAGLWLASPHVGWYVGLSGVLHGLLAAGLTRLARSQRRLALVALSLLAAKLAWEQWHGALPGSESLIGGAAIVDAHLYGTAAALVAVVAGALVRRR